MKDAKKTPPHPVSKFVPLKSGRGGKDCTRCSRHLSAQPPTSAFSPNSRTKDGLQSWCKDCVNNYNRGADPKLRHAAFNKYGFRCVCCGEAEDIFLGVDPVNPEAFEGSGYLYAWLKEHNYPEGFRTQCQNCRMALDLLGKCPHATRAQVKGLSEAPIELYTDKVTDKRRAVSHFLFHSGPTDSASLRAKLEEVPKRWPGVIRTDLSTGQLLTAAQQKMAPVTPKELRGRKAS